MFFSLNDRERLKIHFQVLIYSVLLYLMYACNKASTQLYYKWHALNVSRSPFYSHEGRKSKDFMHHEAMRSGLSFKSTINAIPASLVPGVQHLPASIKSALPCFRGKLMRYGGCYKEEIPRHYETSHWSIIVGAASSQPIYSLLVSVVGKLAGGP